MVQKLGQLKDTNAAKISNACYHSAHRNQLQVEGILAVPILNSLHRRQNTMTRFLQPGYLSRFVGLVHSHFTPQQIYTTIDSFQGETCVFTQTMQYTP